jgi:hypothetical protein
LISNTHPELKKLLANTPFAGDLRGHLIRHPRIKRHDTTVHFGPVKSKALSIALDDVLDNHSEDWSEGVQEVLEDSPF